MRRTVLDVQRVQHFVCVAHHALHLLAVRAHQTHTKVDKVGAVHGALLVLPNAHQLVLTVAGHFVHDVFLAFEVLLHQDAGVRQTNAVHSADNTVKRSQRLGLVGTQEDIVGTGGLNGLHHAAGVVTRQRAHKGLDFLLGDAHCLGHGTHTRVANRFTHVVLVTTSKGLLQTVGAQFHAESQLISQLHTSLSTGEDRTHRIRKLLNGVQALFKGDAVLDAIVELKRGAEVNLESLLHKRSDRRIPH
mmetsp:Transcript_46221/g.80834  ORF Transcript_46221/g.80834 Transcript_46221/m.80834 type:complete len:246 (-) Transcript_46221:417-1154(-)